MNKLIRPFIVVSFQLLVCVCAVSAQVEEKTMHSISQSHVDANVPEEKDFDKILQRDITKYVTDRGDVGISVKIELLRDVPTQAGVALPKFYIWIEKRSAKGELMEEAAARIAAIDKDHFDVVQYYDRKRIENEPDLVSKVFPQDVYAKILAKLKK